MKTYSDRISSQIWTTVGILGFILGAACLGFSMAGIHIWGVMFIYALIIVPFGEIVQRIIVKEKSMLAGGGIGMTTGIFTACCLVGDVTLYPYGFLPMFMLAFLGMMVIPGYVINRKARKP